HPPPTLSWWRGGQQLEAENAADQGYGPSRSRKLLIRRLGRRHLHDSLQCQAANSNISTPVATAVTVDMRLWLTLTRMLPCHRAQQERSKQFSLASVR
ncbi:Peroxidasin-like protein, partial [Frankliniella fusca]